MRTDTATFRNRVFKQVRALGINSVRSKTVARRIVSGIAHGSCNPYSARGGYDARKTIDGLELHLNFAFSGGQYVDVLVDGEFAFTATTNDHVLVSIEPTAEQVELRPALEEAMREVFSVIGDVCQAWDDANGHPRSDEAADVRSAAVYADPAVVAARAAYHALRDRSLASNRFAPISYIDPALHGEYSDNYKYEYGSRPRGYVRYDEAVRFFEQQQRDAANDDGGVADAA